MSKPKFVVFKLKELLLTAGLVLLGVVVLLLVIAPMVYSYIEFRKEKGE